MNRGIRLSVESLDERIVPAASNDQPYQTIEGIFRHPSNEQAPAPNTAARAEWDLLEAIGAYNEMEQIFLQKLLLATQAYQEYQSLLNQVIELNDLIDQLNENNAPVAQINEATSLRDSVNSLRLATQLAYNGYRSDLSGLIENLNTSIGEMNLAVAAYEQATNLSNIYFIPLGVTVSIPSSLPEEI